MKGKRKPMTDKDLTAIFHGANIRFFGKSISPAIKVRYVPQKELDKRSGDPEGCDAMWCPMLGEIWIDEAYKRSMIVSSILVLHEMAHAALDRTYVGYPGKNEAHGMVYQAELWRLIHAGAYDDLL